MTTICVTDTFWSDWRVIDLSHRLGISASAAGGYVLRLQQWAVDNLPIDRALCERSPDVLAAGAGWEGPPRQFTAALFQSDWIVDVGDGDFLERLPGMGGE